MKKKLLTAFLVTALGISMLSGCGGKNSDDNSTKSEQSTKEKDQEAADKVAKLIDDIYVQERTDKTDEQCEAAKKAWDALTDAQKELVEGEKRKTYKSSAFKEGEKVVFADLKIGDYVVHKNYGIGIFIGVNTITADGTTKDYIKIKYYGDDILYVPTNQLDSIRKYVGGDEGGLKINKLGTKEWLKTKAKVKKNLREVAKELIELYAKREKAQGYAFPKDTPWQTQFEDSFPYQETDDQLRCIDEVKKDMETDKPMDRLLCGDVGYGKTEVAIRAAFKAVMDGKQVAFLVPTTILAEQHYKNLVKRFSDFPVKIDMVSRFRTTKQQKATLQALKEGNVDILIGTHRLVSKDIVFKDLGLLIVDEEQRFGVAQKEKIKSIKKNVDVLTLSATPIPRTLHMSLTGVRDISVIETPPEERFPIQTYVLEQNDQLIRDAILREVAREGQVYFVYNRVESIQGMANYISELVPECKVGVIHGQMTEKELEAEMIKFMQKEYDVLVCTTLLERGITIPSVQVVVFKGNHSVFTTASLIQIFGRVGRSFKDPKGEGICLCQFSNQSIKDCVYQISKMNDTVYAATKK